MAHDVAREILKRANNLTDNATLNVEMNLCIDRDDTFALTSNVENENKKLVKFRNICFETHANIDTFQFQIQPDKSISYDGFIFQDFEKILTLFLYQYIIHTQYVVDISNYEVVILKISDVPKDIHLTFCLHVNISDIPVNEKDGITSEILDKILDPINMVFESWVKKYNMI